MDPHHKIELSHDLLARQIARRLSSEERNRRRAERMLRDGLAQHRQRQQSGASRWLAGEDIVFVRSFGQQLDLGEAEWQYLADSDAARRAEAEAEKRALEAQAAQERRLKEAAEVSQEKAEKALVEAEKNKKKAIRGFRISLMVAAFALLAMVLAGWQYFSLLQANRERVRSILSRFDETLHRLDFAKAKDIIAEALALRVNPESSLPAAAELVFFYTEAGKPGPAYEIVGQARPLISGLPPLNTPDTLAYCREAFERMAVGDLRKMLAAKYYPVMVEVKGGTFWMGEEGEDIYEAEYQVTVSDYELAQAELTAFQYHLFVVATDSRKPEGNQIGNHPVTLVSWYDAVEYCNWLSEKAGFQPAYTISKEEQDPDNQWEWLVELDTAANGCRLPTEAEWEFAAGGGNAGREGGKRHHDYAGSDTLDEVGWYNENSESQAHPVKAKTPNELGLYDMSGNVSEWCFDWYDPGYSSACKSQGNVRNPIGPEASPVQVRVFRGCSWVGSSLGCRVAVRYFGELPAKGSFLLGFRPARTP